MRGTRQRNYFFQKFFAECRGTRQRNYFFFRNSLPSVLNGALDKEIIFLVILCRVSLLLYLAKPTSLPSALVGALAECLGWCTRQSNFSGYFFLFFCIPINQNSLYITHISHLSHIYHIYHTYHI